MWEYCQIIWQTNSESMMLIDISRFDETSHPIFKRLYCYLTACKHDFVRDCRSIIGLDKYHLKGSCGGQLLAIVGKDGNENMFPIA